MVTMQTFKRGTVNALKVVLNLTKYIIPAVLVMKVLEHSGWLTRIAAFFAPYMAFMGLPGEGALVILMGQVSIYSAIAIILTLGLSVKQITIISTFISICHAFVLETAIISRAGGNGALVMCLRFVAAVLACILLNLIIPGV